MIQVRTGLRAVASAFLLLSLIGLSAPAQSFEAAFREVDRARQGENARVILQIKGETLSILSGTATTIEQSAAEKLLEPQEKGESKSPFPTALPDGTPVLMIPVTDVLCLEQSIADGKSVLQRVDYTVLATAGRKELPGFLLQAASHGLESCERIPKLGAFLVFQQGGPPELPLPTRRLRLPPAFYDSMKVVRRYKFRPARERFVILVHEPHWMVAGQYQLLAGLKALSDANPTARFEFLVEGWFEPAIKDIPTKPLLDLFARDAPARPQVFWLLKSFLVDGPLAYRVLYGPDIRAMAIDDPALIEQAPSVSSTWDYSRVFEVLQKLDKELGADGEKLQLTGLMNSLLVSQHLLSPAGEDAVKYSDDLAKFCRTLADQLGRLSGKNLSNECTTLRREAAALEIDAEQCRVALRRDATMIRNIRAHHENAAPEVISLVFIGNFHTPAIIKGLPEGWGYVVIEPRIQIQSGAAEDHLRFGRAQQPRSRPEYLRSLMLKLPVAPRPEELPAYRTALGRACTAIRARQANARSLAGLPPQTAARVQEAIESNGFLFDASVSVAGPSTKPPALFAKAFAQVSAGAGGMSVILHDREATNWEAADRLSFLRALVIPPTGTGESKEPAVWFHQDSQTGRVFFAVLDPRTQTRYLFEADKATDVLQTLMMPDAFHMLFSRNDRILEEATRNG
jgi:hypothetical protein